MGKGHILFSLELSVIPAADKEAYCIYYVRKLFFFISIIMKLLKNLVGEFGSPTEQSVHFYGELL
jgi:uncharacterized membrane protein